MFRALLALFRPLHAIAKELTLIRELYELELSERRVDPKHVAQPLIRITEKARKSDTEVSYVGENQLPRYKQWNPERDDLIESEDEE